MLYNTINSLVSPLSNNLIKQHTISCSKERDQAAHLSFGVSIMITTTLATVTVTTDVLIMANVTVSSMLVSALSSMDSVASGLVAA